MTQAQTNPSAYLRTKILTARPEELRLMLYEGAVKFCRQARHAMNQRDIEGMYNAITRAQKIVLELSTSLDRRVDADLCDKLAALYNYIYLRLVDANMTREVGPLDEATNLLDFQRETWVMALGKLRDERDDAAQPTAQDAPPVAPVAPAPEPPNPIATIGPRPAAPDVAPAPAAPVRRLPSFAPAPAGSSFSVQG
jgi:flagellar protein FliS